MTRKGDLSLQTIVVAALVLLVLVVLAVIFLSQSGKFSKSVGRCNGVCVQTATACPDAYPVATTGGGTCENYVGQTMPNAKCCISLG